MRKNINKVNGICVYERIDLRLKGVAMRDFFISILCNDFVVAKLSVNFLDTFLLLLCYPTGNPMKVNRPIFLINNSNFFLCFLFFS